ncbi:hypothetical protein NBRC116495_01390 [Aurantivibrio plasticivorans]
MVIFAAKHLLIKAAQSTTAGTGSLVGIMSKSTWTEYKTATSAQSTATQANQLGMFHVRVE